jgi:transcriptional regulator GlxA family with amidase domain
MKPEFPLLYASGQRVWFPAGEMARVSGVLNVLVGELRNQHSGWEAMALALVQQIVVSICRAFVRTPLPPEADLTGVGAALAHIEHHFDEHIDLKKLEQISNLTARTLLRHCETATGHSHMQYLHRVRLNEACRLLKHTAASVTEIAFRVGFQDSNYFARCFRKIIGESPTRYRGR